MTDSRKRIEIPSELSGKLAALDKSLTEVEKKFEPLLNVSQVELNSQLNSLDKAKLDLVAAYSINSLFWMYLNVSGVNPKDHGIKQELDRIRGYMTRVKEIQDKEKAPKLDKPAAKRFMKSAMWSAAQNETEEPAPGSPAQTEFPTLSKEQDRRSQDTGSNRGKKRKSSDRGRSSGKRGGGNFGKSRYMNVPAD